MLTTKHVMILEDFNEQGVAAMKNVFGDAAIDLLNREKHDIIAYGDLAHLHTVYESAIKAGAKRTKNEHPLNIHQRVLNALDRDSRFKKKYFRASKGLARMFELISE